MGIGMIEPYTAVGLIPSFWGIRRREDIEKNLEHLESLTKAAFWLSNLDIPVRLVAIPEGACEGMQIGVAHAPGHDPHKHFLGGRERFDLERS